MSTNQDINTFYDTFREELHNLELNKIIFNFYYKYKILRNTSSDIFGIFKIYIVQILWKI